MWNAETVTRLSEWYKSPSGAFALEQEYKLFQQLVSSWPRRGHTLLDVGCGAGVFLNMFWEYGFDVTGFDTSDNLVTEAKSLLGNRADFRIGPLDHLPFDAGEFDYVALLSVLEYTEDSQKVLAEAIRVAKHGLVIGFMNSWSLYRLLADLPWRKTEYRRSGRWMNLFRLERIIRTLCPDCRITSRSALLGPPETWKKRGLSKRINGLIFNLPVGAYLGVRIDTKIPPPLTPLLLKVHEQALA